MPPPLDTSNPAMVPMGGGPPPDEVVMGFFNLEGAGLALSVNQYTQQELITRLVEHARDRSDPKLSQKAITQLLAYLKEVASVNGRIGKASREITAPPQPDSDGRKVREVVSTQVLTSRFSSRPGASSLAGREFLSPSLARGGETPGVPRGADPPLVEDPLLRAGGSSDPP